MQKKNCSVNNVAIQGMTEPLQIYVLYIAKVCILVLENLIKLLKQSTRVCMSAYDMKLLNFQ